MYENLPIVPETDRPRPLFLRHTLDVEGYTIVTGKGWIPTDVRLIKDPQEAIKATLEGARIGVIALSDEDLANLMAEAKVYGLLTSKKTEEEAPSTEKTIKEEDDLESILSFGRSARRGTENQSENKKKDRRKKS